MKDGYLYSQHRISVLWFKHINWMGMFRINPSERKRQECPMRSAFWSLAYKQARELTKTWLHWHTWSSLNWKLVVWFCFTEALKLSRLRTWLCIQSSKLVFCVYMYISHTYPFTNMELGNTHSFHLDTRMHLKGRTPHPVSSHCSLLCVVSVWNLRPQASSFCMLVCFNISTTLSF